MPNKKDLQRNSALGAEFSNLSEKKSKDIDERAAHKDKSSLGLEDRKKILRDIFEEVFSHNRGQILRENFFRGIAFGFGTFLGGTIVIAAVVWILSFATDLFPWLDRFSQDLIRALEK